MRQGLGPFVARDLVAAGAEIPCFLVTRESSLTPALADLERHAGVSPRGYWDAERMLDAEAWTRWRSCPRPTATRLT